MATLEFDRNRKSMSVIACALQPSSSTASGVTTRSSTKSNTGSNNVLFVKGAAEYMLNRCNKVQASALHNKLIASCHMFLSPVLLSLHSRCVVFGCASDKTPLHVWSKIVACARRCCVDVHSSLPGCVVDRVLQALQL